tara:strand:+ start:639 stop:1130 length:492 start_codon:yes stop_codon:yes gene_type:complete
MVLDEPRIDLWRHTGGYSGDPSQGSRQVYRGANAVIVSGLDICDLASVRFLDLSQYSGVITIEEPDTDDPFRTDVVPQLVLQFHDIDMTMLGYLEPEPKHVQQALTFARETDGPLLVHCRAGVSRSTAIALAIASDLCLRRAALYPAGASRAGWLVTFWIRLC